jgi:hypothetical protein
MQLSMFSAEEPPANRSALRACEKGWLTHGAISCSPLALLQVGIGPAGWFGRTSPASFPATQDETLQDFWALSRAARSPRQSADGKTAASCPALQTHTVSPIECLTLNTSEHAASPLLSPSADAVCSLSDILETGDVQRRYYLTAKACQGILRRAEKRGKVLLPEVLSLALRAVASQT